MRRPKQKMEHVPSRLREIRKAQGKSVVGLAHDAGLHPEHLRSIESGRVTGHVSIHMRLAKALGVSLDEYFGFGAVDLLTGGGEILKSDPHLTVEKLASPQDAGLRVHRIQIGPHKTSDLTHYLAPEKPSLFYLAQGAEANVRVFEKAYSIAWGEHFWLPRPAKLRIENPGTLPLIFLLIQPEKLS